SLDAAFIDLAGAFAYGQGYVALSRVRSLAGLFLGGLNARSLEVDPTVLEVDGTFRERSLAAEEMIGGMSTEEKEASKDAFVERCGGKSESEIVASPDDALAEYFAVAEGESATPRKQRRVKEPKNSRVPKAKKEPKWTETLKMILEGDSVEEVARKRARTVGTIIGHLVEVQELDQLPPHIFESLKKNAKELVDEVGPAIEELDVKGRFLRPAFDRFQGKYSYDELRLAQWLMGRE
ncbi:MAG: helix-turn-helix domain-containing protein, partial [Methylococcaceae bacterium]